MPTQRITFPGHSGELLAARLDLPTGPTLATALFAHCFTCSKDSPAAKRIAARLAAMGIAVLRFDFTGLGNSEGEFANTHFSSNVEDLLAAAAHLESQNMAPSLLIGHSLGGAAVIKAATQLPAVKAVVTIGAPMDPEHVVHNFGPATQQIAETGSAKVTLGGRPFEIRKAFLDDVSQTFLNEALAGLHKALLVLHAPLDTTVGIENAAEIFGAAKHPKSFITLDDADHLITREADANYAATVIAAWAARYLALQEPAKDGAPEGIVRVREADKNGFLQDIAVGPRHVLAADEPASVGGTNAGPTPYQLLSSGLGACTTMTIRMYARRKGIALDHVEVDVTHNKTHADECANCEDNARGKIDQFTRIIRLEGELSTAERTRLMEIADRCPVHRTLEATSHIVTESG